MEPNHRAEEDDNDAEVIEPDSEIQALQALLLARNQQQQLSQQPAFLAVPGVASQFPQSSANVLDMLLQERINSNALQIPSNMLAVNPFASPFPTAAERYYTAMASAAASQQQMLLQAAALARSQAVYANPLLPNSHLSQVLAQEHALLLQRQQLMNSTSPQWPLLGSNLPLNNYLQAPSSSLIQQQQERLQQQLLLEQAAARSRELAVSRRPSIRAREEGTLLSGRRLPMKRPRFDNESNPQQSFASSRSVSRQDSQSVPRISESDNTGNTSAATASSTNVYSSDATSRRYRSEPFPMKLLNMMEEAKRLDLEHLISFTSDGTAFQTSPFLELELFPKFFRHQNYASFRRQLSMYGFTRIMEGPNRGAYMHPLFRKNRPDLVAQIKRVSELEAPAQKGSGKPKAKDDDE
ncbi:hypothetical protein MPSEU_000122300 [Mayamaea pseudoterrestris]|nr:hypothetical protein MPSEU_000122300 [Mayamaea pseudoterrestris]